jgi:GxxExxY protein
VKLPCFYEADVICYGKIILEIKAISRLTEIDDAQLINYLKATGIQVGVLMNFGKKGKLDWRRFVYTNDLYFKKENVPK